MTLTIKEEKERVVSKGGNSSVLYLPREYFSPGERLNSQLEVDSEGNLENGLDKETLQFLMQ